jgi:hypothetical protein
VTGATVLFCFYHFYGIKQAIAVQLTLAEKAFFYIINVFEIKMLAWWFMIGTPNVFRSMAYFVASSRARWARPTAPDATGGRV